MCFAVYVAVTIAGGQSMMLFTYESVWVAPMGAAETCCVLACLGSRTLHALRAAVRLMLLLTPFCWDIALAVAHLVTVAAAAAAC